MEDLKPFQGSLVGFLSKQEKIKGCITLKNAFGAGECQADHDKIYISIDAPSSYNKIIEQLAFNYLGSSLSTLYLCMKYPFPDRRLNVIQGEPEVLQKVLHGNLEVKESLDSRHKHHEYKGN